MRQIDGHFWAAAEPHSLLPKSRAQRMLFAASFDKFSGHLIKHVRANPDEAICPLSDLQPVVLDTFGQLDCIQSPSMFGGVEQMGRRASKE